VILLGTATPKNLTLQRDVPRSVPQSARAAHDAVAPAVAAMQHDNPSACTVTLIYLGGVGRATSG
jgi:hypothetical protein